ncbi:unnamed protein product [Orchesella dallaii]|uniref:Uncharacterized protein n=1 Tax=Orchesella dallaii TaxID=48710 RepID=A0ABP1R4G6_9HEXA
MDDIVVIRNTTLSNKDKQIVKELSPLYSSTPGRIEKQNNHDLTYEVTFQDGTTRGPLHADMLRLYHPRDDAPADTPAATPPPHLHDQDLHLTIVNSSISIPIDALAGGICDPRVFLWNYSCRMHPIP